MLKLVVYSAKWCAPCRAFKSGALKKWKQATGNIVEVVDVDKPAGTRLADDAEVQALPTITVVDGGGELQRRVGSLDVKALNAMWSKAVRMQVKQANQTRKEKTNAQEK